jgi:hypothetical protein
MWKRLSIISLTFKERALCDGGQAVCLCHELVVVGSVTNKITLASVVLIS